MSHLKRASKPCKRQPSGTGGRKASQPKDQSNGEGSRATITPNGQLQPSIRHETTTIGTESVKKGSQHLDSYDPARISQWAAHSAIGPSSIIENDFQGQCNLSCENDLGLSSAVPQIPGHFPVSQPACLNTLPSSTSGLPFNHGMMDQDSMARAHLTRLQVDCDMSSSQGLDFPLAFNGSVYHNGLSEIDDQAFSPFVPGDFGTFSAVGADPSLYFGNDNTENAISSSWGTSCADIMHPLDCPSTSGLTPSSSSMQSSHSFLGHQADTPISTRVYDEMFGNAQDGPLENVNGVLPAYSLNNAMTPQASMNYTDPERFLFTSRVVTLPQSDNEFSTIRPNLNFQRAPIPSDMWTGYDGASQSYGLPMACSNFSGSRRSSEGEAKNARDHAFYKAFPEKDGLYHCPYTVSEKCSHKPDKLKCNYDKHLDSHLKPYRCKSYGCSQIQFSSTACLLRHEREAHGMHGHGPKPHLCFFKDCDRAQEDNGFPRRWNLFDHMRRVHEFHGTEPSNKSNSPSPSLSSSEPSTDPPKKRRTPSPPTVGATKRAKVAAPDRTMEQIFSSQPMTQTGTLTMVPEHQPQSLNQIWYDHAAQVQARLQSLDPTDPRQWQQYQADTATLQNIGLSIQYQQQAQLAH